jgi:hypothetical protein
MLRWTATVLCLGALCLCFGCGDAEKDKNPNPDLQYSKEGPPKRGGIPSMPGAKKTPNNK